ncbi:Initiator Replication protein [Methylomagnum ishizawai]|uniref:Initiator Replication protein n=1 Tax=Methylomagnum ishizawai TaxID=1760988 RepID=A0A1Y6D5R6_9GAMM|nr:replication initiation protein [Methylomagnum ishizawai]SMF97780.1 Initiator Replication protein [Methylomagnum ishizawai]
MELKNFVVTKANALIQASYRLNLNEQRLVLCCVAQLDPRQPLAKDDLFTVNVADFAAMFSLDMKNAYRELEDAATALYERDIRTHDGKARERFRWVSYVKYETGESRVTLRFSYDIAPYLSLLRERFTSYQLEQISSLRSTYSIRLFEFLMQYKKTGRLIVLLKDFKTWLELESQYPRFFDLQRRVIDPAVQELREKNQLDIQWKAIKKSRSVERLEFTFKFKEEVPLSAAALPAGAPELKPATIERFRELYPRLDPYACKNAFDHWTATKKRPADYDQAFLGFAAKWQQPKPSKSKQPSQITREEIEKHARPGESWDDVRSRLSRKAGS